MVTIPRQYVHFKLLIFTIIHPNTDSHISDLDMVNDKNTLSFRYVLYNNTIKQ